MSQAAQDYVNAAIAASGIIAPEMWKWRHAGDKNYPDYVDSNVSANPY